MKNITTIVYMAFILILGIFMIVEIEPYTSNLYVRKCFHLLAFVLFLIPIVNSMNEPPVLLVLAFNLVTLALIALELFRYNEMLPSKVSKLFKYLSDGFERQADTLIVTHIYLLMGCAFPLCATFILIGGGVFPDNWVVWSLAGIIFLGLGDSAAAIFGKNFGTTKWRQLSNKTKEGSTYCILFSGFSYIFLTSFISTY